MAENIEPTTDETETELEAEVEAHAESILPLQSLSSPEPDGLVVASKSTASIVC